MAKSTIMAFVYRPRRIVPALYTLRRSLAQSVTATDSLSTEKINMAGIVGSKTRKGFFQQRAKRTKIDVYARLEWTKNPQYTHPVDHPKLLVISMERQFLERLLALYESNARVTAAIVVALYKEAIETYATKVLTPQLIVNMLTSFLAQYDLEWIRESVVPFIPKSTEKLGYCSQLVLHLCITAYSWKVEQLTEKEDKFVLDILTKLGLDTVSSKSQLHHLHNSIFHVICKSSRWRQQADVVIAENQCFAHAHGLLINRSLKNSDYSTALKLLECGKDDLSTLIYSRMVFNERLADTVHQVVKHLSHDRLPDLLSVLRDIELSVPEQSAVQLISKWNELLSSRGVSGEADFAGLTERGECSKCGRTLDTLTITESDVKLLKQEFYEKSIVEEGLFHLADPVAIEKFVSWIKKNSPYDLVIDGMNAFHCPKPNNVKFTKLMQSNMVKQVLSLVGENRDKRVLIIVRGIAKNWIPEPLKHLCDVYTLKNYASDDVFTIYAALSSGPNCYILSTDEFRQHTKHLATKQSKHGYHLFNQWQSLRQIPNHKEMFRLYGQGGYTNNQDFKFSFPLQTKCTPQCHDGCWHVPVTHPLLSLRKPKFAHTQRWLCLPAVV